MSCNSELLTGLSVEELEVLAEGLLAPAAQARLGDLLARKREKQLSPDEETELDRLLQKVDDASQDQGQVYLGKGKGGSGRDMSV
jgi:hypothetical protein